MRCSIDHGHQLVSDGLRRVVRQLAWFGMVCAAAIASPAAASNANDGYITGFVPTSGGTVFFFTTGTRGTPPACSNVNFPARWGVDASTNAGQAVLSVLMTAHTLHQIVDIAGSGVCVGDSESVAVAVTNNVQ